MKTFKSLITILIIGLYGCFNQESKATNEVSKIANELQGTWAHSEDSSATVEISGDVWSFKYRSEPTLSDTYNITIADSLPQYVDQKVNSKFLILTKGTDTLEYEISGLNDSILSLMYFPRGNMHLYEKMKK